MLDQRRPVVLAGVPEARFGRSDQRVGAHAGGVPTRLQPLEGGLALPGEPLRGRPGSFELDAVLEAGRLQAAYLNKSVGRTIAGGRMLVAVLVEAQVTISEIGTL